MPLRSIKATGALRVKHQGSCVKPRNIAKAIAALLWLFMGLVSIAVGWSFFQGNPSVSVGGDPVNFQFAIGYIVAGILLLSEAALTFLRKKAALILSVPVAMFTAVSVFDQLNQLAQGTMVTPKYLVIYGAMFSMSVLTTAVVLLVKKEEVPINA